MGLLITLLVGALVGWLASMLMKTNNQMGAVANIVVGIVGAWLGGVAGRHARVCRLPRPLPASSCPFSARAC